MRLELRDIEKRFGGVQALRSVSFDLKPGEVHALVGENGAGKSTLIKVLSGAHKPDAGSIVLNGKPVVFSSPRAAQAAGIATIYQETSLYPDLSVLENLFMGHQPLQLGRIDWRKMRVQAEELFDRLGLELPLRARLGDLGKARGQLVEIAKALLLNAQILILDEPTAALTTKDADALLETVRGLRERGVSMIYISHRLEEITAIADRVTVIRDGEVVESTDGQSATQGWMVSRMVGRAVNTLYPRTVRSRGKPLLEVNGLTRAGTLDGVSFSVHEGEIVGLAGLVGSGQRADRRATGWARSPQRGASRFGDAARGPWSSGFGAAVLDPPKPQFAAGEPRRLPQPTPRRSARQRVHHHPRHPSGDLGPARLGALRRQPAKNRDRQMAGNPSKTLDP
jgi:rhamnose transport system ATP-binding protein